MNAENLIPNEQRTPSQRRENARKAGIASGEARRRRKSMAQLATKMLNAPANEKNTAALKKEFNLDDDECVQNSVRLAGVIKRATQGYAKENAYLDELNAKGENQNNNTNQYAIPILNITKDYVDCYRAIHEAYEHGAYREIINKGGRGSVKSTFWSEIALETIYQDSQAHCVMCRRYKTDLKDSVYNQFIKTVTRADKLDEWEFSKSPLMATRKETGQTVMFVGADKPISLKSYNVTFGYVKLIVFEECDEMAGIEQIDNVEDTFLRGNTNALSVKVFNPPKSVNNWMNEYTVSKQNEPTTFIAHSYYYNVPVKWLGKRFFERAEWFKQNKPKYYANNYLGEVVGTGGTIFENVEVRTITDEEMNNFNHIYYGLDYGFEHPQSFIECAYDSETETVYILYELRKVRMKQENFAKRLISDYKQRGINIKRKEISADSARPDLINDWEDYGFDIYGATKHWKGGGRDYSWEWLQTRAKIVIDEARTPCISKELRTAEFEQLKDGSFSSQYPKLKEDCIMACIYALNDVIRDEKKQISYYDEEEIDE